MPVPGTGLIYDLASTTVLDAVDAALGSWPAGFPPDHAILVTGTGAPSLDVLDLRAPTAPVPVLSSNLAGAWLLLETAGVGDLAAASASPALRHLAATVRRATAGQ